MRHWLAAAIVAVGSPAFAGDDLVQLGRYQPPAGGFGGAVQTAAAKETLTDEDSDTVLAHGRYGRGYGYGGYRGGYGGYGGYGYGYRSSYSYYPRYSYGFGYGRGYSYSRPYYSSYYGSGYGSYYGSGYGSYAVATYQPTCYVSSWPTTSYAPVQTASYSTAPTATPTVVNNYYYTTPAGSAPLTAPRPMIPPSDAATPKYDGGPMNPVPQPVPDPAKPMTPPNSNNVKISTAKSKPALKYPAYGEK